MNKTKLIKDAVTLKEFSRTLNTAERATVESEKKYYQLIIALKEKRKLLGLTQEKLAELSDVPRTTITKVESGSRNTTLETLMRIAQALGSTVELRLG